MIIDRKIGVAPRIAAIAFVAILAGCSSAPDKADDPSEIAYAICLEYGSEDRMPCKGLQLPNPASQLAYVMCLEYHQKDAAPCNRLRDAYRTDLRAYLESLKAAAGADPAKAGQGPRLDPRRAIELHHTARRALQGNQQRCRHLRRRALGRGDAPSRRRRPGPDAVRSGIARARRPVASRSRLLVQIHAGPRTRLSGSRPRTPTGAGTVDACRGQPAGLIAVRHCADIGVI